MSGSYIVLYKRPLCLYIKSKQKLIYSLAIGYIEVKQMSAHIYEQAIMDAWYAYDGPLSFEAFYATYIPA